MNDHHAATRNSLSTWQPPPDALVLRASEVHLWQIPLSQLANVIDSLKLLLNEHERQRAARLRLSKKQREFIVARAALRTILSRYTQMPPEDLIFSVQAHGKPELANRAVRFNMTHSHDWALVSLCQKADIGIDLEYKNRSLAYLRLAQRYFSKKEAAQLAQLPAAMQRDAFFAIWTRKEAILKAMGNGISFGLDRFDVSVSTEHAELLATDWAPAEKVHWTLCNVAVAQDYAASFAVRMTNITSLKQWIWGPSTTGM